jgi:hypothetical protein
VSATKRAEDGTALRSIIRLRGPTYAFVRACAARSCRADRDSCVLCDVPSRRLSVTIGKKRPLSGFTAFCSAVATTNLPVRRFIRRVFDLTQIIAFVLARLSSACSSRNAGAICLLTVFILPERRPHPSDVGSVSSPGSFRLGCAKERSRFSASVEWMRTRDAIG